MCERGGGGGGGRGRLQVAQCIPALEHVLSHTCRANLQMAESGPQVLQVAQCIPALEHVLSHTCRANLQMAESGPQVSTSGYRAHEGVPA